MPLHPAKLPYEKTRRYRVASLLFETTEVVRAVGTLFAVGFVEALDRLHSKGYIGDVFVGLSKRLVWWEGMLGWVILLAISAKITDRVFHHYTGFWYRENRFLYRYVFSAWTIEILAPIACLITIVLPVLFIWGPHILLAHLLLVILGTTFATALFTYFAAKLHFKRVLNDSALSGLDLSSASMIGPPLPIALVEKAFRRAQSRRRVAPRADVLSEQSFTENDAYSEAKSYHQRGQLEHAIELYDKVIANDPFHCEAYQNRGRARFGQGDLTQIKHDVERGLDRIPVSDDVARTSISDLDRAIELNPEKVSLYRDRGLMYLAWALARDGAINELVIQALADLDRALSVVPLQGEIHFYRALIYERHFDDPVRASSELRKAATASGSPETGRKLRRRLWWLGTSIRSTAIYKSRITFRVLSYPTACNTVLLILLAAKLWRSAWKPVNGVAFIVFITCVALFHFYIQAWEMDIKTLRGHDRTDFLKGAVLSVLWAIVVTYPQLKVVSGLAHGIDVLIILEVLLGLICLGYWVYIFLLPDDCLEDQRLRRLFKIPA